MSGPSKCPKCPACKGETEYKEFMLFTYFYCSPCKAEVPAPLPEPEFKPGSWADLYWPGSD